MKIFKLLLKTSENLIERAKIKKYKDISFRFQSLVLKLLNNRVHFDEYLGLFIIFDCYSVCPVGPF